MTFYLAAVVAAIWVVFVVLAAVTFIVERRDYLATIAEQDRLRADK